MSEISWNPRIAAVASFFIPGLGQIYKGDISRGFGLLFAFVVVSLAAGAIPAGNLAAGVVGLMASLVAVAVWVFGVFDAFKNPNTNAGLRL